MTTDRFTIRQHVDGGWDIADRDFPSLPDSGFGPMSKMDIPEAERVVQLMNELDQRLRTRTALSRAEALRKTSF
ncbi:hypothetical protein [Aureimonas sp. AU22]|uniref:hypothetical protein n=1 Tax=Aureimonas sp. AU22 TaxID=1638162 RepID=UPI000781E216|nr:hypothetical protein [Aureimonas sp. AU22]